MQYKASGTFSYRSNELKTLKNSTGPSNSGYFNFPVLADSDFIAASSLGLKPTSKDDFNAINTAFLIDASKQVRMIFPFSNSSGYNFNLIHLIIKGLQDSDEKKFRSLFFKKRNEDYKIASFISEDEPLDLFLQGYPKNYIQTLSV